MRKMSGRERLDIKALGPAWSWPGFAECWRPHSLSSWRMTAYMDVSSRIAKRYRQHDHLFMELTELGSFASLQQYEAQAAELVANGKRDDDTRREIANYYFDSGSNLSNS